MDLRIKGRKAVICASSKGLGKGCATALAEAGCEVVINGRDERALEAAAKEIVRETGAKVTTVAADVGTKEGRAALLAACPQPDILVNNNAGPPFKNFRELDHAALVKGIEANMGSALRRSIPIRRPVEIDDAAIVARHAGNRAHLLRQQLETGDRDVFTNVRRRAGARNRDHIGLLDMPAQKHLRWSLAVRLGDFLDCGIARTFAAAERTIGCKGDAVLAAGGEHFRLIEPGMIFALVGDDRLARDGERLFEQRDGKIRHADVACETACARLAQRLDRFFQRNVAVRPVDQQEIELVQPEPLQAAFGRALQVAFMGLYRS